MALRVTQPRNATSYQHNIFLKITPPFSETLHQQAVNKDIATTDLIKEQSFGAKLEEGNKLPVHAIVAVEQETQIP
jgi:hypothetical protein